MKLFHVSLGLQISRSFFYLHEIHLSQEFADKDGKTNLSTCLGIDTLRLPTQEELKQIPTDDAIALFGKASIIAQESVSVEADDLVFAVADASTDAVSLFEDEESYQMSYMEALSTPYKGNYILDLLQQDYERRFFMNVWVQRIIAIIIFAVFMNSIKKNKKDDDDHDNSEHWGYY